VRGLVFEQGPDHFGRPLTASENFPARQIERRIFRVVAGEVAQPVFAQAVDQPSDAGPVDRARAHRAGLGGGIQRRTLEHFRSKRRAGLGCQQALGVRGAVTGGHIAVLGLDQHVAVPIDENGGEWVVAVADGAAGDVERSPQEKFVEPGLVQI
jgi:hypothetical protein